MEEGASAPPVHDANGPSSPRAAHRHRARTRSVSEEIVHELSSFMRRFSSGFSDRDGEEMLAAFTFNINDKALPANERQINANQITTTKYTLASWIPVSLLVQFKRIANVYFVFISILMLIGTYATHLYPSPIEPFSTIFALIFVMMVTTFKEGYDDYNRYKADESENQSLSTIITYDEGKGVWEEKTIKCKDIQEGDIIKLEGKTQVPADMLLLMTSEYKDQNTCYVETCNIDGETNMKVKMAPAAVLPMVQEYAKNYEIQLEEYKRLVQEHKQQQQQSVTRAAEDETSALLTKEALANHDAKEKTDAIAPVAAATTSMPPPRKPTCYPPPAAFKGEIEAEGANKSIYTFIGALHLAALDEAVPLNAENVLLRSSVFSNTDWGYGVAIYTGTETKIQMNNQLPATKLSNLEGYANQAIICVFIAMVTLVTISVISIYLMGFDDGDSKLPYVYPDGESSTSVLPLWLEKWFVYFILYNNFIPISLYVTMEIVNLGQADMIAADAEMYEEETDTPCMVKSGNLVQELGQISHIFSDKTGTLTRNEMNLVKFVVDDVICDIRDSPMSRSSDVNTMLGGQTFEHFMRALLLCHTVVPNHEAARAAEQAAAAIVAAGGKKPVPPKKGSKAETALKKARYRAESPDELALILGVEYFNSMFMDKSASTLSIRLKGAEVTFDQLAVNAFNADRKRMSVLMKSSTGEYFLICKGADNIMLPLTKLNQNEEKKRQVAERLHEMAVDGLRTLVIAQKKLTESQAMQWLSTFKDASSSLEDRESKLGDCAAELEQDMDFLGITAIEDMLQEEVPEVIADLATGGIILWMLTGDKEETAVNIGLSCNLLLQDTQTHFLTKLQSSGQYGRRLDEIWKEMSGAAAKTASILNDDDEEEEEDKGGLELGKISADAIPAKEQEHVLVLDGPSFRFFREDDEEQKSNLLHIGQNCRAVIACRLTPGQKAQLVNFIKTNQEPKILTLAIGDGANDVPMIQEADVGVGIFGKEGHQAANNADFAIAQFKYLRRLLLVHGRSNYIGQSHVCLYSLHKNMVLTITLFWYSYYASMSGTSLYESLAYTGYNFFLGLPIIFYGILNKDLDPSFVLEYPQVYATGRENRVLQLANMIGWFLNGVCYAIVICCLNYLSFHDSYKAAHLYEMGTVVLVGMTLTMQAKLLFMSDHIAWPQTLSMLMSVGGMYGYLYLVGIDGVGTYAFLYKSIHLYGLGYFWFFSAFATPLISLVLVDLMWHTVRLMFWPSDEMLYREVSLADIFTKNLPLVDTVRNGTLVEVEEEHHMDPEKLHEGEKAHSVLEIHSSDDENEDKNDQKIKVEVL